MLKNQEHVLFISSFTVIFKFIGLTGNFQTIKHRGFLKETGLLSSLQMTVSRSSFMNETVENDDQTIKFDSYKNVENWWQTLIKIDT